MKALSIKQPWAGAVMAGIKRVENRSWTIGYRGPIAIHASLSRPDVDDVEWCAEHGYRAPALGALASLGCVLGTVTIAGMLEPDMSSAEASAIVREACCVDATQARSILRWWGRDCYGWLLTRPERLVAPVRARGACKIWTWSP
jgi:hypothetical protein